MQVIHCLPTIGPTVDHHAVATGKIFLPCHQVGYMEKMPRQGTLQGPIKARNRVARHYQNMRGRLWRDVSEGHAVCIFVDDVSRDFALDDALKERRGGHDALGEGALPS